MQWLQDKNQSNLDNRKNVRRETSKCYRNKTESQINELDTNSNIRNNRDLYMGISDVKNGYQTRTNLLKNEKGGLVADCLIILARRRERFSQL
jgi:hypothetical protein